MSDTTRRIRAALADDLRHRITELHTHTRTQLARPEPDDNPIAGMSSRTIRQLDLHWAADGNLTRDSHNRLDDAARDAYLRAYGPDLRPRHNPPARPTARYRHDH